MGQKGQRSDTHTLTHEAQTLTRDVVTAPFRLRTYRLIRKILIGFILVSIANVLFSYFFYTPKMYRIIRENRDLVIKYRILQDRIRTAQRHVDEIRHRDNYVYRSLFSTDTMSIEGVWQPSRAISMPAPPPRSVRRGSSMNAPNVSVRNQEAANC